MDLTKRNGNNVFKLTSFTRYSNQPQKLTVSLDSLIYSEQNVCQNASRSIFYTDNATSWGYKFNPKSRIFVDFNLQASLEDLNTNMNFIPLPEKNLSNDIRWNRFNYIVSPSYTYDNYFFVLNFGFPVNLVDLYVNDYSLDKKDHYNYLLVNPSLNLIYNFNEFWKSSLSAEYRNEIGDIFDLTNGLIMSNYRYFKEGSGVMEKREYQNYSWRLSFRDAINTLFFNMRISYRPMKQNLLSNRTFIKNYSISKEQEIENHRDIRSIRAQMGKYFNGLKTNISLSTSYTQTNSEQKQQNTIMPVTYKMILLDLKTDTKLGEWGAFTYKAYWINNRNYFHETENAELNQTIQNFNFFIFPVKKWQIKLQGEYLYNDITSNLSKELFFGDIGVKYQLKSMEFSFDWTNILNQKEYSYTSFDGVNTFYTGYNLRPTNFLFSMSFKY